jgi:hypothetical protein
MKDPNELSREAHMLMRFGPLLIALWGWAALAMAVSTQGLSFILAVIGFAASVAAARAPRSSAVTELLMVGAIVMMSPSTSLGFVALGAALVVAARAVAMFLQRRFGA